MATGQVKVSKSAAVPEWTIREQLVLASAVQRSGDQNWVSVSRAIKPLVEDVRSTDYFSQKNCALQYAAMLDKVSTPNKRKKRASEEGTETREQQIVRELSEKRIGELSKSVAQIRKEYLALSKEVELLEKGELDDKVPGLWEKLKHELGPVTKQPAEGTPSPTKKHTDTPQNTDAPKQSSPSVSAKELQGPIPAAKDAAPLIKQVNEGAFPAVVKVEPIPMPDVPQLPLKEKSVAVKKELPSGTSPSTDGDSPLARLSSSIGDDRSLSPMQTPQPTSSDQPPSANLHIIVQQRNKAVDSLLADGIAQSTEPKPSLLAASATTQASSAAVSTLKPVSPITKQHPLPSTKAPQVSMVPVMASPTMQPVLPSSSAIKTPAQTLLPPKTQTQSSVSMTFLSPVKQSTPPGQPILSSHLPKSVPIMAYLSKTQNVSQPHRGSMLQSLVSASSSSLLTSSLSAGTGQALSSAAAMCTTAPPATGAAVTSLTAARMPSPLVSRNTHVTSPIKATTPASIEATLANLAQAPRPPVMATHSQTAAPRVPSAIGLQPSIRAAITAAVATPVTIQKVIDSLPQKISSKAPISLAAPPQKKALIVQTPAKEEPAKKPEGSKDIKTLLTLPPTSVPKHPVKVGISRETKQQDTKQEVSKQAVSANTKQVVSANTQQVVSANTKQETSTDTKQEVFTSSKQEVSINRQKDFVPEPPNRRETTPIKAETENEQQREVPAEAVNTPVSSPLSTVGSVKSLSSTVVETPDGEMEEDTPTKVRKGRSILQRTLLTRSRKRKAEDEGQSVESTDTEEDGLSSQATSAVPSPAPSQSGEMDIDALRAHKQWKKGIMIVWRHAAQHKYANFFLHPVREEDAPGYKDIVLCPTDLSTIKRKIESGHIKTDIEFQREMLLMFQNAFMYNSSDHEVYEMAQSMKSDVMENLQTYLATQAQLQLVEDPVPTKTLRGRRGDRDQSHDESLFSPATKKRRTRNDDRD